MFSHVITSMKQHFKLWEYQDCVEVTNPTHKEVMYVLMEGQVASISDDRTFKRTNFEIKKTRKKRTKLLQKFEEEGGASNEEI
jgi:hypothetical protein